jgi:hypothetical protein
MSAATFVQLGATRDGIDAYRAAAHRRGMQTVLVESPAYLEYRASLPGRVVFDKHLAVPCPGNPGQVLEVLDQVGVKPDLPRRLPVTRPASALPWPPGFRRFPSLTTSPSLGPDSWAACWTLSPFLESSRR